MLYFGGSLAMAQDHSNNPKVFDQALMDSLMQQGYAWDDLVQGSILAHYYKVPLKSILDLRPADSTWAQVETALKEMDYTRKMPVIHRVWKRIM